MANTSTMSQTRREFLKQACRWHDTTNVMEASRWWDAFVEAIVREVYYNGRVVMPGIGTIFTKKMDDNYITRTDENGKKVVFYQPARNMPTYTPDDDFINDVNMVGVTKAFRHRLKTGKLTQRDRERALRARAVGFISSEEEEEDDTNLKVAQENFAKMLEEKKRKAISQAKTRKMKLDD